MPIIQQRMTYHRTIILRLQVRTLNISLKFKALRQKNAGSHEWGFISGSLHDM